MASTYFRIQSAFCNAEWKSVYLEISALVGILDPFRISSTMLEASLYFLVILRYCPSWVSQRSGLPWVGGWVHRVSSSSSSVRHCSFDFDGAGADLTFAFDFELCFGIVNTKPAQPFSFYGKVPVPGLDQERQLNTWLLSPRSRDMWHVSFCESIVGIRRKKITRFLIAAYILCEGLYIFTQAINWVFLVKYKLNHCK